MSSATDFFRLRVRDHVKGNAAEVGPEASLADIVGLMATDEHSAVVVADAQHRPVGIVTERDIVRRVAFNADASQPAADIMTRPVRTVAAGDRLFIAISRMRRLGHRHMPVVDGEGRLAGLLDMHPAMVAASGDLVDRIEALTREDSVDGMREIKAAQADLADDLIADGVSAVEVQTLLTQVNNDIYRRLTDMNLAARAAAEAGDPPVPFCLIVMGSCGRGENFLNPDQDFGFILADGPEAAREGTDAWFAELAAELADNLDAVGLPYCTGNVMATNPQWRKTITEWRDQIDIWNRDCMRVPLLDFDIFFDFAPAWDDPTMAQELRQHVTEVTRGNEPFLRALYRADRDKGTALRWFGRFATERDDPAHRGKIHLKHYGTLPLVEGVRMLTLREGIVADGTLERLAALRVAGIVKPDEFDALDGAYRTLCDLLLRQQIADFKDGLEPTGFVHPKRLGHHRRDRLREAFRAIDRLRDRINLDLGGEIF